VRFKVVKVSGVGLLALWKEKKVCNLSPPPACTLTEFFAIVTSGKASVIRSISLADYVVFMLLLI
jgi:hypothetical protein